LRKEISVGLTTDLSSIADLNFGEIIGFLTEFEFYLCEERYNLEWAKCYSYRERYS